MKEVWKSINTITNGYNYEVSNCGRIRHSKTKQVRSLVLDNSGYYRVVLRKGSSAKSVFIHRMVASVFCKGFFPRAVVDHIDNNPKNNHQTNLRWVTRSFNTQRAYDQKRKDHKGSRNSQAKLTEEDVYIIKKRLISGDRLSDIAKCFDIHISRISEIKRNLAWIHVK